VFAGFNSLNRHSKTEPPPSQSVNGSTNGNTEIGAKLVGIFTIIVNLACLGFANKVNGNVNGKVPYSMPLLISTVYPNKAAKSIKSCTTLEEVEAIDIDIFQYKPKF